MAVDLLHIARSGLNSSRNKMNVVSHNISNANTEGYTRQRALINAKSPIPYGNIVFGSGSTTKSINRINDQLIEKSLNKSLSEYHFHKKRTDLLSGLEDVLNEINTGQLNKSIGTFFNAFRLLTNNPEDDTLRSIIRENARQLVNDFRTTKDLIKEINDYISRNTDQIIYDVNSLLSSIAKINLRISKIEASAGESGDLRDQRDNYIRELAKFVDINTYQNEKGRYIVDTPKLGTLVSGDKHLTLFTGKPGSVKSKNYHLFLNDIYIKGRGHKGFGKYTRFGELGALFNVRLNELKYVDNKIDELAFHITQSVNAIHKMGFSNNLVIPSSTNETNINFFNEIDDLEGSAYKIGLSDRVEGNTTNIAASSEPNSPGNNKVAMAISNLQYEQFLNGGKNTIEEYFLKLISEVGLINGRSKVNVEQMEGILAQAKAVKERTSGVSLDEESALMTRYQKSFDASARMIRVADEMMGTILGLKR